MKASDKVYFTSIWFHVRAMILVIHGQTICDVLKPWAFSVVSRIVLQCTVAEMAGIAIRGDVCGVLIPIRWPLPARAIKGFANMAMFLHAGGCPPLRGGNRCVYI